ncbi:hypothetical protein VKT23_009450 [Stygiomarasmius scandens]|uniref:Uncharacterized protein n=1 Tax=Marasmiellus scandens TaxID=2682957 RepID=A0ABR1JDT7_9AGAR
MDPPVAMNVDQSVGRESSPNDSSELPPAQVDGSTLQLSDNPRRRTRALVLEVPTVSSPQTLSNDMEVDFTNTRQTKRKRVSLGGTQSELGLVNRLEVEVAELKQAKANLEIEIDDVNYQLKTEISDLKRANKSLREETINLRAVDVSLVDNIDHSSLTLRESEKLMPLIAKLHNYVKRLEDPSRYVAADFEPSNETEQSLLAQINQLKILHNTALNQQSAFLASMQRAQGEKEAFHKQTVSLQEANTQVQDDLRKLQHRIETLQKSQDESDTQGHTKKGLSPEFRSISAQTDGGDTVTELGNLRENMSRIKTELEQAKQEADSFQKARDRLAAVLKAKREEHEKEKEQHDLKLQQSAE